LALDTLVAQPDPWRGRTLASGDWSQTAARVTPEAYTGTRQRAERLEECVEPV